jgi:elongation factor G
MGEGVLTGFPLEGLKIRLFDGGFHAVDSDSLSFELAARAAYRAALPKCAPILKEPIMAVEVVTPEEYMGPVVGDLNRRRGHIGGMDSRGNAQVVKAKVPLSELFGYVTTLRTLSSGRAASTMQFSHYQQAPANIQDDVIAKAKGLTKV